MVGKKKQINKQKKHKHQNHTPKFLSALHIFSTSEMTELLSSNFLEKERKAEGAKGRRKQKKEHTPLAFTTQNWNLLSKEEMSVFHPGKTELSDVV